MTPTTAVETKVSRKPTAAGVTVYMHETPHVHMTSIGSERQRYVALVIQNRWRRNSSLSSVCPSLTKSWPASVRSGPVVRSDMSHCGTRSSRRSTSSCVRYLYVLYEKNANGTKYFVTSSASATELIIQLYFVPGSTLNLGTKSAMYIASASSSPFTFGPR